MGERANFLFARMAASLAPWLRHYASPCFRPKAIDELTATEGSLIGAAINGAKV